MLTDADAVARLLAAIAVEAGRGLAAVADRGDGRLVKPDGSASTAADRDAERLILARLAAAFPEIPVVAEESAGEAAAHDGAFFLVDPLDGTSDFLSGEGEYSVNIALVSGGRPVAAALVVPPLDRVWAAGGRAVCAPVGSTDWKAVRVRPCPAEGPTALVSRRHGDETTERLLAALPVGRRRTTSSAAKFGLIASGEADLYVRCGATMEWDTAAGDHILTRAGGTVVGPDRRPLVYGRGAAGYRNGPFAACGDLALIDRLPLPERCVSSERDRP